MCIWCDAQALAWEPDARAAIEATAAAGSADARLLRPLPGGVHFRPCSLDSLLVLWECSHDSLLVLWECWHAPVPVPDPPPADVQGLIDPLYAEVVLRGASTMAPGLAAYTDGGARRGGIHVDGGFYTSTAENFPVIGACPGLRGASIVGALSGFGVMGALGAGELAAAHASGRPARAEYAPCVDAFAPARFATAAYRARMADSQQLRDLRGSL